LVIPAHLREGWPDWYHLAAAFVFTYGTGDLASIHRSITGELGRASA
jgi:hypothetical protein